MMRLNKEKIYRALISFHEKRKDEYKKVVADNKN